MHYELKKKKRKRIMSVKLRPNIIEVGTISRGIENNMPKSANIELLGLEVK